jgi:hypothetical protein
MNGFDDFVGGWNLNKGYYDHINEVIVGTDIAAYKNDAHSWRKFLRMIYRKVHKRLKDKALKEIDKQFQELDVLLDWTGLGNDRESQSLKMSKMFQALDALDKLEILMLDEMHDEGLLPQKEERIPPGRAVEDFGY